MGTSNKHETDRVNQIVHAQTRRDLFTRRVSQSLSSNDDRLFLHSLHLRISTLGWFLPSGAWLSPHAHIQLNRTERCLVALQRLQQGTEKTLGRVKIHD